MVFMDRLRQLLSGSTLFLVEYMVLDVAEDGSPSISVPMLGQGTLIVAPEEGHPDKWGVMFVTLAGLHVAQRNVPSDTLLATVLRHIVPGANPGDATQ